MSKVDIQLLNVAENMPLQLLVDSIHNTVKCSLQFSLEEKDVNIFVDKDFHVLGFYLLTDLVKFQEEQRSIGSLAGSDTGMLQIPLVMHLLNNLLAKGFKIYLIFLP